MVNKHSGVFTKIDEESFETFANYCGLALHHAKLYDKIRRSEQVSLKINFYIIFKKYKVALEVLAYHSVCNRDEVNKLKKLEIRDEIPELDVFVFNLVIVVVFIDLNLMEIDYLNWKSHFMRFICFENYLKI